MPVIILRFNLRESASNQHKKGGNSFMDKRNQNSTQFPNCCLLLVIQKSTDYDFDDIAIETAKIIWLPYQCQYNQVNLGKVKGEVAAKSNKLKKNINMLCHKPCNNSWQENALRHAENQVEYFHKDCWKTTYLLCIIVNLYEDGNDENTIIYQVIKIYFMLYWLKLFRFCVKF